MVFVRASLKPRLTSPSYCFSSKMDSESGDTDNVSSSGHETCSTGTYTQKEKVRPKQLPVPVGVREFEGETVVADNVSGRYKLYSFGFNFEINVERFSSAILS